MAKIPVMLDHDGEPMMLEQPDDEPGTNLPGILLGLAIFPFAILAVTAYLKLLVCAIVHTWHWISF